METKFLEPKDISDLAMELDCELAVLNTIVEVEGSYKGFSENGEPYILFHRDVFARQTKGVYNTVAPDISNQQQDDYDMVTDQHERLHKALMYNHDAALMATGWGRFQIMGFNYALAGFSHLQDFISAMYQSEKAQLAAFVQYLKNLSLDEDLRNKNWKHFARKYKRTHNLQAYIKQLETVYLKYAG